MNKENKGGNTIILLPRDNQIQHLGINTQVLKYVLTKWRTCISRLNFPVTVNQFTM